MKKLFALLLCSVLLLSLGTVAFAADSDPNSGLKNRLTPPPLLHLLPFR